MPRHKKKHDFTNVVLNLDDNTVWWEDMDDNPPKNALNWKGPWDPSAGEKGAHPTRFTAPAKNCCISPEFESPEGVPISAIVFGGRRAKTAPWYQSRTGHWVFMKLHTGSKPLPLRPEGGRLWATQWLCSLLRYNMGDYWRTGLIWGTISQTSRKSSM